MRARTAPPREGGAVEDGRAQHRERRAAAERRPARLLRAPADALEGGARRLELALAAGEVARAFRRRRRWRRARAGARPPRARARRRRRRRPPRPRLASARRGRAACAGRGGRRRLGAARVDLEPRAAVGADRRVTDGEAGAPERRRDGVGDGAGRAGEDREPLHLGECTQQVRALRPDLLGLLGAGGLLLALGLGVAGGLRPIGFSSRAALSTSSMCAAKTNSSSLRACSGTSTRSFSLRSGMMIRLMPARCAARTFSLMPPTGSTRPRSVTSPVIADVASARGCR